MLAISAIALLIVVFPLSTPLAHAAACTNSYASGSSAPVGYAPAWNPLTAARELLVQGTECTTSTATVKVGSGAQTQLVYNKGYFYTGSAWQEYSLTSTTALQNNAWYTGNAQASIQLPQTVTYVVGYVCQQQGSAWKCGCRDSTCATSYWQLQAVKGAPAEPAGGGTSGGDSTGPSQTGAGGWKTNIEAPPTMDAGYLLVENKCPGESGWPSASQMAGRDVKFVMPKDRDCSPSSNLTAIAGTESNPVRDVWIVGGVLRGSGYSFRNYSGTMFIEGVIIDQKGQCQDAVNSYYGRGDGGRIVVQNSHITGVHYCNPGTHGDTFHAQGSGVMLKEYKAENMWAHQIRQGIFVPPRTSGPYPGHGVKKMTLDHVFLEADPNYAMDGKGIASMIYWAEGWGPPPDGVHMNQVYLKWWGGKSNMSQSPWANVTIPNPSGYNANGCAQYGSSAKVTGTWCRGNPPKGNFIPLDKIGRNYSRAYFTNG